MKRNSQTKKIRLLLLEGHQLMRGSSQDIPPGVTPIPDTQIPRLASRISDLKKGGLPVKSRKTKDGWAVYYLPDEHAVQGELF